jgi:hypothetical protein
MPIQAFGSPRVVEALNALAGYLDEAVKSAARIPAGKVARLKLENIPRDLGPRLTAVSWTEDGSENVFVVHGFYLKDVNTFKLVKGATQFTPVIQTKPTSDSFTATLNVTLPRGRYDALVIDEGGQAFVLRNAVAVGGAKYDPWPQHRSIDPDELVSSSIGERSVEKKSSKADKRK